MKRRGLFFHYPYKTSVTPHSDAESPSSLQKESFSSALTSFLPFLREIPDRVWDDGVFIRLVRFRKYEWR